jgi:phage/plasmid-associated DNA primase
LFLNLNNRDVSQAYFKEFPHKYIFGGDIKNKKSGWFGFKPNNIIINYGAVPTGLLNHISEYMQEQAQKEKMNLSAEMFKVKTDKKIDADERQKLITALSNNIKKVNDAYLKLGSSTFINGCICFLADSYYNEEIDQLLDSNNKIIAFKNGLYDFENNIFRPIEPTDYISKCTNYDYIPTSNNKLRIQINKLLDSIFGSDDVKKYFMAVHGLSLFSNSSESL